MKLIGEIETVSYNGLWVIRAAKKQNPGSTVYNHKKQKVGRIINVIGPVDQPYLIVRPFGDKNKTQLKIIGEKLYTISEINNKKRR